MATRPVLSFPAVQYTPSGWLSFSAIIFNISINGGPDKSRTNSLSNPKPPSLITLIKISLTFLSALLEKFEKRNNPTDNNFNLFLKRKNTPFLIKDSDRRDTKNLFLPWLLTGELGLLSNIPVFLL